MDPSEAIKKVIEEKRNVVGKFGKKELYEFYEVDTLPFTKEELKQIEKEVNELIDSYVIIFGSSSSFWKEENKSVQRIMFIIGKDKADAEEKYFSFEELRKKDHRYLGPHLDIFHFEEEIIGPGLPLMHPKGAYIRRRLIEFMRSVNDELKCEEVWAPHLSKTVLWHISGHYEKYNDKMFLFKLNDEEFGLKPMNCPLHIMIYKFKPRSYRELPIRFSEFATVYRKEQSGELHGLTRVWSITQDDHHFYVKVEDLKEEVKKIIKAVVKTYEALGFKYKAALSTRPEKFIGDIETWNRAEKELKEILDDSGMEYEIEEGEGAFYGPKIDFEVEDNMKRKWQLATIQLDFNLPERFQMEYVDKDGNKKRPIIIHFAILGSIERFIGILIENYGGRLPTWINPLPVAIIPVAERHLGKAKEFSERLDVKSLIMEEGTVQNRVRLAEEQQIKYICIIGDKEVENNTVAVRFNRKVETYSIDEFINKINEEAKLPKVEL